MLQVVLSVVGATALLAGVVFGVAFVINACMIEAARRMRTPKRRAAEMIMW